MTRVEWQRVSATEWRILDESLQGKAVLNETNSGFIVSVEVTETQFNMQLLDEREFFPSKKEAVAFLKEQMDRNSY